MSSDQIGHEGLRRLDATVRWMLGASKEELADVPLLADWIGRAGLACDRRTSPMDPNHSLYGDDVRYMLGAPDQGGSWQTPTQLAGFLALAATRGVRSYLDVGTYKGWTITLAAAYLKAFGLEHVDTYDVEAHCSPDLQALWRLHGLPISYHVSRDVAGAIVPKLRPAYDLVFIDGSHEYADVRADYERNKGAARILVFHDVIDHFCGGVVRLWRELREETRGHAMLSEFTTHPNGFDLMGIGVLEWGGAAKL